jgi:pimeloyl-ACP methyl ester carboxylesterase
VVCKKHIPSWKGEVRVTEVALDNDFATLTNGRMHFVAAGRGVGIVLLHGWPGLWFDYRHVLPLAGQMGRCITPDFLGFGASDPPNGDPVEAADEESFARDILELFDSFGVDDAIVVGHDIGSAVGAALARLAPERVRGLVLLNPTHPNIGDKRYTPDAQREAWYQAFHLLPLAEQMLDGNRDRVEIYLTHFYEHWAGRERITSDELKVVVEAYARPGAFASSIWWYRARAARRSRQDASTPVEIPTIALWGDRDPMRPLDHREGFERTFPRSESRVLPEVGHFVPAEAPDAVVGAIADLL